MKRKLFVIFLSVLLIIISFAALNKTGDKKVKDITKKTISVPSTVPITKEVEVTKPVDNESAKPVENEVTKPIENRNSDYRAISSFKEINNERYEAFGKDNPTLSDMEIVKRVNIDLDYDFYEKKYDALNPYTPLVLVNKYYYIGEDYVPTDLEEVNITYASGYKIYAVKEAKEKFEEMSQDAKNLGYTIKTISAYRSYTYQKALYEGYMKNDPQSIVDTYSARAGHSEHQTGYAFDVYNGKVTYTSFGNTEEYIWAKDNIHRYGFIIRYTKENEYITGYKNEPWHLRYVGIENATSIYNKNITLEEYLLN